MSDAILDIRCGMHYCSYRKEHCCSHCYAVYASIWVRHTVAVMSVTI